MHWNICFVFQNVVLAEATSNCSASGTALTKSDSLVLSSCSAFYEEFQHNIVDLFIFSLCHFPFPIFLTIALHRIYNGVFIFLNVRMLYVKELLYFINTVCI